MKPNDKAIEAGVKLCWDCPRATPSMIRDILTAAYAAQFPPSEDYAELVEELRENVLQFELKDTAYENIAKHAADALEAVLAERKSLTAAVLLSERQNDILTGDIDRLRAELAKAQEITRMQAERIGWYINEQEKRDAVLKPRTSLAEAAAKERDAWIEATDLPGINGIEFSDTMADDSKMELHLTVGQFRALQAARRKAREGK